MILDYKPCRSTSYEFFQQKGRNLCFKLHPIRNIHFQIHKPFSTLINFAKFLFFFKKKKSNDLKITVAAHYFHEEKNVVKDQEMDVLHEKLKNSLKLLKVIISESKFGDTHRTAHLEGNFEIFC